jgi:hypothetical protein
VEAWLAMNNTIETSVQVAYRIAPAGRWPADYQLLDVAPGSDAQNDGRFLQQSLAFSAASSDPYYIIVQSHKGTGTISFTAQEGTAEPLRAPAWLLVLTGVAVALALAALGMTVRAWLRRPGRPVS